MRSKKTTGGAALAVAAALVLSACGDDGGTSAATGEPIIVASVNSLSGPGTFPEASEAAQAVFDEYNAEGGLEGRPIEYTAFDDKGDPATASQVAREAVGSGAVALVGSASVLDCEVNHTFYEESDILSIQGTGVDPYCFTTPNISPVDTGPYIDTELTLGVVGLVITRWLPESSVSARSAVTVAALLLLISMSYILFGTRPMRFRAIVTGTAFEVGGAVVSQVTVLLVLLAVLIASGAGLLLRRTLIGTRLRAIADRPVVAEMLAIPSAPSSSGCGPSPGSSSRSS